MKNLGDQIRDLISRHSKSEEIARTNRQNHPAEGSGGNSAICARDYQEGQTADFMPCDPEQASWSEDAVFVYRERMAIAADLGMDLRPGSEAEQVARREARRVQAGFSPDMQPSPSADILDAALEAFGPLGGLTLTHIEPRKSPDTPPAEAAP